MNTNTHEVVIIGGGPAGLSAALYNSRAGLNPVVFAGSPPGGQLTLTTEVENFPGIESVMGPELIMKMREQVKRFNTTIIDKNIKEIDISTRPFKITPAGSNEEPVYARALIVATGAKALWLGLDSEQQLRGKGVSACATCDGFFFRNKVVAVVGGGDTAMEDSLTLTKFATKVYVIHRRNEFRASKIMQDRVKNHEKIEILWNTEVRDILGGDKVTGIKLFNNAENKESELALDAVFVAIGHKPDTELVAGKVELDEKGYILNSSMAALQASKALNKFDMLYPTMTSVPGVFAAGDCVDHIYRQASTSAGMGVSASMDAERWLELNHA